MTPKATMRKAARAALRERSREWIAETSRLIQERVLALDAFARARVVSLYRASPEEIALDAILEACRADGKIVLLPAWIEDISAYGLARWDEGAPLAMGQFGIEEPAERIWVPGQAVDLAIVTALAFDEAGYRLGHGGGYFDRLLATVGGVKLLLAFECQKAPAVPREPHDIRLDLIATERALYRAT
ncbi:MAG: 5-formyltetrahydrofolate cyclo-ligase [Verrucomicrobia bacterium]|nr:5-formyltetrahydrofolate cyclo-ligase [Kiritimatiellia bacterium]MCO6400041.1 5-formyltetrahydrofolate cyclo-ligase [Verrucomicrobiota bacterium]